MLETEHEQKRMTEVYESHKKTCLYVAKSVLGDDDWLAEDAVHNTFMGLIEKKELLLLPDHSLKALLLAVVKRKAIDLFRQKTRHATDNLDDIESIPSPEESIEVMISSSDDFQKLTERLSALDEPHRSILQLKYFSELSNTKIGEYLGITNRQVETQLYNAKLKLRKNYYACYPGDEKGRSM